MTKLWSTLTLLNMGKLIKLNHCLNKKNPKHLNPLSVQENSQVHLSPPLPQPLSTLRRMNMMMKSYVSVTCFSQLNSLTMFLLPL